MVLTQVPRPCPADSLVTDSDILPTTNHTHDSGPVLRSVQTSFVFSFGGKAVIAEFAINSTSRSCSSSRAYYYNTTLITKKTAYSYFIFVKYFDAGAGYTRLNRYDCLR
jgi:hypothetical protein